MNPKLFVMRIKKNIALSDTGFVFNPSTGDSFSVNPIGLEILKMMKDNKKDEEIKSHIMNTYQTDADSVEKDFYDFTKMLEQIKLVEGDGVEENK
jgi:Coenzyme PQQ synthesis protein D (PqqD)